MPCAEPVKPEPVTEFEERVATNNAEAAQILCDFNKIPIGMGPTAEMADRLQAWKEEHEQIDAERERLKADPRYEYFTRYNRHFKQPGEQ